MFSPSFMQFLTKLKHIITRSLSTSNICNMISLNVFPNVSVFLQNQLRVAPGFCRWWQNEVRVGQRHPLNCQCPSLLLSTHPRPLFHFSQFTWSNLLVCCLHCHVLLTIVGATLPLPLHCSTHFHFRCFALSSTSFTSKLLHRRLYSLVNQCDTSSVTQIFTISNFRFVSRLFPRPEI